MMYRLQPIAGEIIDRTVTLSFTFEGKPYEGFAGDTISAALAAAGVMVMGRSFKYHRPRGIFSFANHDVNVLFQIGDMPNVRGDVVALEAGMQVDPVNTFGSLAGDSGRWMESFARFLLVGFYYKAFYSRALFPYWKKLIRGFSGLGRVGLDAVRTRTPKRYVSCDVLVIGGGVSGSSAALAAANAGARVLLVDEAPALRNSNDPVAEATSEFAVLSMVGGHPNIAVIDHAFAAGYYADHWIAVIESQLMTKVRARSVVLATGAIEQPAVFRNNDLPGVLTMSATLRLLRRHAIGVGRRVVVAARSMDDYAAALELVRHGVAVTHIIEQQQQTPDYELTRRLKERRVELLTGRVVVEAHPDKSGCVHRVTIAKHGLMADKQPQTIDCDALIISGARAAATQLLLQAGGTVRFDAVTQMHLPDQLPAGVFAAGRMNGVFNRKDRVADGHRAGAAAAGYLGFVPALSTPAPIARVKQVATPILAHPRGNDFIDFDEDIQVKDLENAAQEGFDSIELLKRYTTVGMGPSQGKHSNVNAAQVLARIRKLPMDQIGLTTARPMVHPVPLKHLAGRGFSPQRVTPIDQRHAVLGAVWMLAGHWRRPEYYARHGETREQSIAAEVATVREAAGLIDVGTLGKLEVYGRDAGEFLDRVYSGRYSDLAVGTTRYALMLDESGTIIDDGVIARSGKESFYFTTTTGGSAGVYRELLRLNALWGLECALVNLTGHLAAFNLAGPASRQVLATLTALELKDSVFPYLGYRETTLAGVNVRLLRVGFVGEIGYEVHVPFTQAAVVWDELVAAGAASGMRVFGVEAQRVLRLEKGHLIVGQDTDRLTNPFAAQAKWAVKMQKPFFIGQRSLRILEKRGPRQLLVGFDIADARPELKECHLVIDGEQIAGRITSIAWSHTLLKTIGLAMVNPTLAAVGTRLVFRLSDGATVDGKVCETPFYDPEGKRQKQTVSPQRSFSFVVDAATSSVSTMFQPDAATEVESAIQLASGSAYISPDATRPAVATFEDRQQRKRIGLKGPHAAAWLRERGIAVPERANAWTTITASENDVVMRLGSTEFFFEQSVHASEFDGLANSLKVRIAGVYPVLREDRAFMLSGPAADAVLAEVCSVNFNGLLLHEQHAVMTMMIGVAVTVVPQGNVAHRRYLIWCDPSFGDYLSAALRAVVADVRHSGAHE